jgi:protein required for attachment to host cells
MKLAHGTLVLAADGSKALLFRNRGDEKYAVLEALAHQEISSPPTHESGSDRPGRSFASTGVRRSGLNETDWHRQDEERFAGQAAELFEGAAEGNEAGLVILAPAQFLGSLRRRLKASFRRRLVAEIEKDVVHRQTGEIAAAIDRHHEKNQAPSD